MSRRFFLDVVDLNLWDLLKLILTTMISKTVIQCLSRTTKSRSSWYIFAFGWFGLLLLSKTLLFLRASISESSLKVTADDLMIFKIVLCLQTLLFRAASQFSKSSSQFSYTTSR